MAKEVQVEDWIFRATEIEGKTSVRISPPQKLGLNAPPSTLGKYYSLNAQSVKNLYSNSLWASHPIQFNDLFDCHEGLIKFDNSEFNKSQLNGIELTEEELNELPPQVELLLARNYREIVYSKWGVLCLTNKADNPLMWGYYTNNQGFFIEFDWSKFPFKFHGPYPIIYLDNLESISMQSAGVHISNLYQSVVKSSYWKHENEWRILIQAEDGQYFKNPYFIELNKDSDISRVVNYPADAIKRIALGNRFLYYKEIKPLNAVDLELNISRDYNSEENHQLKNQILTYIASAQVECPIAIQGDNFSSIRHLNGKIEKAGEYKYIFHSINY